VAGGDVVGTERIERHRDENEFASLGQTSAIHMGRTERQSAAGLELPIGFPDLIQPRDLARLGGKASD
jgi:hypothetical protein